MLNQSVRCLPAPPAAAAGVRGADFGEFAAAKQRYFTRMEFRVGERDGLTHDADQHVGAAMRDMVEPGLDRGCLAGGADDDVRVAPPRFCLLCIKNRAAVPRQTFFLIRSRAKDTDQSLLGCRGHPLGGGWRRTASSGRPSYSGPPAAIDRECPDLQKLPKVTDTGFYWYDKSNIDDPKIAAVLYD